MPATTTTRGQSGLIEGDESPQWTFGEKISCVRVFRGTQSECMAGAPLRGALGSETVAMMQRHEAMGTLDHPQYQAAITLLNYRHVCRLE